MKRLLLILLLVMVAGCRNPFFPRLGEPQSSWTDQTTIGGLLQNFRNAYNFQDSLRYSECLSCPDFQFQFYDPELGDYDWMSRQVDLTTTGRLFRHYNNNNLELSGLDQELLEFSTRGLTSRFSGRCSRKARIARASSIRIPLSSGFYSGRMTIS